MVMASDMTRALEHLATARPAIRPALHASAVAMALQLADERDELVKRLEIRWEWCALHQDHPSIMEREDVAIADLETYKQMEDALRMAADVLFGEAA